jgi:hypothetical protein
MDVNIYKCFYTKPGKERDEFRETGVYRVATIGPDEAHAFCIQANPGADVWNVICGVQVDAVDSITIKKPGE